MGKQLSSLEQAAKLVEEFGVGPALTTRIRAFEAAGVGLKRGKIEKLLAREDVGEELIAAAGTIKVLAGQVHVIRHAAGIPRLPAIHPRARRGRPVPLPRCRQHRAQP